MEKEPIEQSEALVEDPEAEEVDEVVEKIEETVVESIVEAVTDKAAEGV